MNLLQNLSLSIDIEKLDFWSDKVLLENPLWQATHTLLANLLCGNALAEGHFTFGGRKAGLQVFERNISRLTRIDFKSYRNLKKRGENPVAIVYKRLNFRRRRQTARLRSRNYRNYLATLRVKPLSLSI
jgi:hypothetical protein